ncbi:hypothetical protein Tco_0237398 [Tanacetum coccineum]
MGCGQPCIGFYCYPDVVASSYQFEGFSDSNDDSTSIDDDSFSIDDIDYVEASPPDSERRSKLNYSILHLQSSFLFVTKSPSTFLNSFLEETNTFDNSLTESETFRFNLEEISSGSTTTRSDYSLPDYEAFYLNDDHIEEKSSGSTTTHADFSLPKYDSFIFDLSINPFPPADRSDFYHEEFADELAHIISPPDLECFYFKIEPDPGDLIDPGIRENVSSTTNVNLPFEDAQSPLLAFVVWIFLAFLTYPVTPPYLLSCGNEDTIFDPSIPIYHSSMPGISHRDETFMTRQYLSMGEFGTDIKEMDKYKDKAGQNRVREWNEREKTSPMVPSDFIGPARYPLNGSDQPK